MTALEKTLIDKKVKAINKAITELKKVQSIDTHDFQIFKALETLNNIKKSIIQSY